MIPVRGRSSAAFGRALLIESRLDRTHPRPARPERTARALVRHGGGAHRETVRTAPTRARRPPSSGRGPLRAASSCACATLARRRGALQGVTARDEFEEESSASMGDAARIIILMMFDDGPVVLIILRRSEEFLTLGIAVWLSGRFFGLAEFAGLRCKGAC